MRHALVVFLILAACSGGGVPVTPQPVTSLTVTNESDVEINEFVLFPIPPNGMVQVVVPTSILPGETRVLDFPDGWPPAPFEHQFTLLFNKVGTAMMHQWFVPAGERSVTVQ